MAPVEENGLQPGDAPSKTTKIGIIYPPPEVRSILLQEVYVRYALCSLVDLQLSPTETRRETHFLLLHLNEKCTAHSVPAYLPYGTFWNGQ